MGLRVWGKAEKRGDKVDRRPKIIDSIFRVVRSGLLLLGLGLLRLLALLPYPFVLALGRGFGGMLFYVAGGRRRVAGRNLELCFPELGEMERRRLLRRHFRALGMGMLESIWLWWAGEPQLRGLAHIQGLEHLRAAQAQGRGVIALSAHFTSLEMGATLLSLFNPTYFMYRPHDDPALDRFIYERRMRWTEKSVRRDNVREMIRLLRQNKVVWYAQDQNTSRKEAAFVKFFGQIASTNSATARLAKLTGAAVVPYCAVRREDGGGYDLILEPALEDFPSGDIEADTQRINDIIERWVRRYPDQYLWVHRRFRTRPNRSDPSPYA